MTEWQTDARTCSATELAHGAGGRNRGDVLEQRHGSDGEGEAAPRVLLEGGSSSAPIHKRSNLGRKSARKPDS